MQLVKDLFEESVLREIALHGQYIGKKGCVLCLPKRQAAARLVEQGIIKYKGEFNGKQVWVELES